MSWSNDDCNEWERQWQQPIMQRGLTALKEVCRVSGKAASLAPGYDALVLAGLGYAHAQGQSSVFDAIAELAKPVVQRAPLPPEFERTPRPKPKTD